MYNPFPDGLVDDRDDARIVVASGLGIFDSLEGLDGFSETRPVHPVSQAPRFVLSHSLCFATGPSRFVILALVLFLSSLIFEHRLGGMGSNHQPSP